MGGAFSERGLGVLSSRVNLMKRLLLSNGSAR